MINSVTKYDIICLTETWLTDDINNSIILQNKFTNYRSYRNLALTNKKTGGGVLSVNNNLSSSLLYDHQSLYETVCILVKLNNLNIIISILYMPPIYQINLYEDYLDRLNSELFKHNNFKLLILGDFNVPKHKFKIHINKIFLVGHHCNNNINYIAKLLKNEMNNLNLLQFNQIENNKKNILDFVFSDLDIELSSCDDPLVKVDKPHPPLYIKINYKLENFVQYNEIIYDFKNCDYKIINLELSKIKWSDLFHNIKNIDELVKIFYNKINETILNHVPKKNIHSSNFPKWYSKELISAIISKKIAHRQFQEHLKATDKLKFETLLFAVNVII